MLAAVLLSIGASAQSEYYALANQTAGGGTVVRDVSIQSTVLGREMLYSVYLPAGYTSSKQYPVLYLLHGYGGDQNDWWVFDDMADDADAMISSGEIPEMIIVTPDGGTWMYIDNCYGNGINYEQYFFQDLMTDVESRYSIRRERGSRAIGGFSMGGYGQTRTGWQSTPDGREGWSDIFLKKGYSVFLVDQPRRGAAGATEEIVNDPGDVANGKFKVGAQAWYTHFRIGRVAPERYEGSQLPEGVTIAKDDNGEFLANISGRHTDFVYPQINYDAESGQYNFATISALTGNDGPVWTLTLQVSDDMAVGDYTINLNKIRLTLENYETVNVSSSMSRLTIVEKIYRKGDVNDDDDVDIADLVCVVNHVVGIETPVFLEPAADVIDNGKVDISDAVKILDYIVGDIDALAPAASFNLQAMAPVRRAAAQQPQDMATEGAAVYAGAVKVMLGEQAPLTISLKNCQTTCGYQFDLILPAGITLAATDGKYNCVLSDRHNGTQPP